MEHEKQTKFFTDVHKAGQKFPKSLGYCGVGYVKAVGAHNFVRPKVESFPHYRTHQDDCKAILGLIAAKRIDAESIMSRVVAPEEAPKIFDELCNDRNFPMGTVIDWREV